MVDYEQLSSCKWYFLESPVGVIVKLRNHRIPCMCKNICQETNICRFLYTCTCYEYLCLSKICIHIRTIQSECSVKTVCADTYDYISAEDILEELYFNDGDFFQYEKYFQTSSNFVLNLSPRDSQLFWRGFEMAMMRHVMGSFIEDEHVVRTSSHNWLVLEAFINKTSKMEFVPYEVTVTEIRQCRMCEFKDQQCSVCLSCHHKFICCCEDHKSGMFCRHGHAVAIKLQLIRDMEYKLVNEERLLRDEKKRFYVINIQTRIRHNVGYKLKVRYRKIRDFFEVYNDQEEVDCIDLVTKNVDKCECKAFHKCVVCKICIHTYNCSCLDRYQNFICVHMHAVHCGIIRGSIKEVETEANGNKECAPVVQEPQISSSDVKKKSVRKKVRNCFRGYNKTKIFLRKKISFNRLSMRNYFNRNFKKKNYKKIGNKIRTNKKQFSRVTVKKQKRKRKN